MALPKKGRKDIAWILGITAAVVILLAGMALAAGIAVIIVVSYQSDGDLLLVLLGFYPENPLVFQWSLR